MGNINIKVLLLTLTVALLGCEKMEIRGFFTSYDNVNSRFMQSNEWNISHGHSKINIALETYTIHVMSDSHIGGTENLDTFFADAMDENVAAAIMVGDITTGHKEDYEVLSDHLPSTEPLALFATVGNHDLYFDGWRHFYSLFGPSSYFFVINTPGQSDLLICLDTGGGTLGDLQFGWFKNLLETSRGHFRYCMVFTHNNLFRFRPTASTNPMVEELHVLQDLFLRYQVDMVITGHDHKQNSGRLGNTTHIIMGALLDEDDNASYLKLSVNADNIDYSFVEL